MRIWRGGNSQDMFFEWASRVADSDGPKVVRMLRRHIQKRRQTVKIPPKPMRILSEWLCLATPFVNLITGLCFLKAMMLYMSLKGASYLKRAADQDDAQACFEYGLFCAKTGMIADTLRYFKTADNLGFQNAFSEYFKICVAQ